MTNKKNIHKELEELFGFPIIKKDAVTDEIFPRRAELLLDWFKGIGYKK